MCGRRDYSTISARGVLGSAYEANYAPAYAEGGKAYSGSLRKGFWRCAYAGRLRAMPSSPFTAGEVAEARLIFELVMAIDSDDDSDDDSVVDTLTLTAVEPLQRKFLHDVGPEKLSLARLQREAIAHGRNLDDLSITDYITFGFRLEWLPAVIAALDVPDEITLDGDHVCIATAAFATAALTATVPSTIIAAAAIAASTIAASAIATAAVASAAVPTLRRRLRHHHRPRQGPRLHGRGGGAAALPAPKHGSVARQRFEIF